MATKTINFSKIRARLDSVAEGFAGQVAKVGWFPGAVYEDGTPVAYVATIHEYGAPAQGIPPRPFMRPTVDAQKDNWVKLMAQGVKAVGAGKYSAEQVLEGVGLQAVGDIQKTIGVIASPALAPATIAARMSRRANGGAGGMTLDKPLEDTGLMIASVSSTVGPADD